MNDYEIKISLFNINFKGPIFIILKLFPFVQLS